MIILTLVGLLVFGLGLSYLIVKLTKTKRPLVAVSESNYRLMKAGNQSGKLAIQIPEEYQVSRPRQSKRRKRY